MCPNYEEERDSGTHQCVHWWLCALTMKRRETVVLTNVFIDGYVPQLWRGERWWYSPMCSLMAMCPNYEEERDGGTHQCAHWWLCAPTVKRREIVVFTNVFIDGYVPQLWRGEREMVELTICVHWWLCALTMKRRERRWYSPMCSLMASLLAMAMRKP